MATRVARRDQHDRDLAQGGILAPDLQQAKPVHLGHHQVKHNDVGLFHPQDAEGMLTTGGPQHTVTLGSRGQDALEKAHRVGLVIHDQDGSSLRL